MVSILKGVGGIYLLKGCYTIEEYHQSLTVNLFTSHRSWKKRDLSSIEL